MHGTDPIRTLLDEAPEEYANLVTFLESGTVTANTLPELQRMRHALLAGIAARRWPEGEAAQGLECLESAIMLVHRVGEPGCEPAAWAYVMRGPGQRVFLDDRCPN